MTSVHATATNFNSKFKINFNGGNLSSDSGLLLYKSFDEKLASQPTVSRLNTKLEIE
ncbi:hypothetical protein [Marinisporobacter balticus]|uniref:hypothetical protein n=1 Tax=Marinisporobacter balticus TaxID=2018667 RepID=UPI001404C73C|nr:hypothetical protein [Marinisporobacter balticus]